MNVLNVLAELSIYATVIAACVILIKKLFFKQLSAAMHYAIWIMLIIRLVLPFTVDTGLHILTTSTVGINGSQEINEQPQIADMKIHDFVSIESDQTAQSVNGQQEAAKPPEIHPKQILSPSWGTDQILLAVWIGGMFVMLLYTVTAYGIAVRKMKMVEQYRPLRLSILFEQEKHRMKLSQNVKLKVVRGLHTPALFFPRTILMPKECLDSMNDDELALALRHELTHYKRKDQWAGLLLVLLQAVYWFHPVVWLAFRQIRTDMEAACDAAVVRPMKINEKSIYANTILSCMTDRKDFAVIGMALTSKRTAKKRIQNIFDNTRTRCGGRIVSVFMAVILFIACFTTACQPTPAQPAVAAKNNGVLEKALDATPVPAEKYDAPARWEDDYTGSNGKLTISVNADVQIPDVQSFPVYKAEPQDISGEQVRRLAELLFGGAEVEGIPPGWPKDKLEEALITFKKDYADSNPMNMTEEEYENTIKGMEHDIADAPEIIEPVSLDDAITEFEKTGRIVLQADIGGTKAAMLMVNNDERFGSNAMFFKEDGTSYEVLSHDQKTTGLQLSEADAVKIAQDFVSQLGLDFMSAAATDVGVQYEREGDDTTNSPRCYIVWFTRMADGIPATYDVEGGNASDETSPNGVWPYERIAVGVDDSGIVQLRWNGNAVLSEKLTENAALLPFGDIKQRFEQGMTNAYIAKDDPTALEQDSTISRHFDINRVTLGMMRIKLKDNGGYSLVPVWDFFGPQTIVWKNIDGDAETSVYEDQWRSHLTINAIDGTVISRTLGF